MTTINSDKNPSDIDDSVHIAQMSLLTVKMESDIFVPKLSVFISIFSCLFLSLIYVGSLYVWRSEHNRFVKQLDRVSMRFIPKRDLTSKCVPSLAQLCIWSGISLDILTSIYDLHKTICVYACIWVSMYVCPTLYARVCDMFMLLLLKWNEKERKKQQRRSDFNNSNKQICKFSLPFQRSSVNR